MVSAAVEQSRRKDGIWALEADPSIPPKQIYVGEQMHGRCNFLYAARKYMRDVPFLLQFQYAFEEFFVTLTMLSYTST